MLYLTAPELAEWLHCRENQFAIMARRLKELRVPFTQLKGCCPSVLRSYHDQLLTGAVQTTTAAEETARYTPNRAALMALQKRKNARKSKVAA